MSLIGIFATAILPIVVVAAVGYALGRFRGVEADALNTVTVSVPAPALVVHSLATSELTGGTILGIVGAVGLFTAVMIGVGEGVGRLIGQREPVLGAFVLVSVFPNMGNYGIPLADFVFGPSVSRAGCGSCSRRYSPPARSCCSASRTRRWLARSSCCWRRRPA